MIGGREVETRERTVDFFPLARFVEEDDDYMSDDENFNDDDFLASQEAAEAIIAEKSNELARNDGFRFTKNQADRKYLVKKLFPELADSYVITQITQDAAAIYKTVVIPERVSSLLLEGNSEKEIAEITGESISKVKMHISSGRNRRFDAALRSGECFVSTIKCQSVDRYAVAA